MPTKAILVNNCDVFMLRASHHTHFAVLAIDTPNTSMCAELCVASVGVTITSSLASSLEQALQSLSCGFFHAHL